MSELQAISFIVAFLVPLVFAGGGMVAAALIQGKIHGRRLLYLIPAITGCAPALILMCVVHGKAIGGVLGAGLVCLLAWRGYRSDARPAGKAAADRLGSLTH